MRNQTYRRKSWGGERAARTLAAQKPKKVKHPSKKGLVSMAFRISPPERLTILKADKGKTFNLMRRM